MIRHPHGDAFLLFTQDDHARLSGQLAGHLGNLRQAAPDPFEPVIRGIAMHDSGWRMHDDAPTLNEQGFPLHVFETPVEISTRVWTESVRLATEEHDYSGLLVSLHVMALSRLAQSHFSAPQHRIEHARELFELNKFQQNQIEAQETLRGRLGLRTDLPLQYGLARPGSSPDEDRLLFNYQILKAMDRVSLALLCGNQPFDSIDDIHPRPGDAPVQWRLTCKSEWRLRIEPWPFNLREIPLRVPVRRVPARRYDDLNEFRDIYAAAAVEQQAMVVVAD